MIALQAWPARGEPENPGAWITTTARNRAIDHLRREAARPAKEDAAVRSVPEPQPPVIEPVADDQLRLLFICCHPALARDAQVSLTLRLVCGLRVEEIARMLLEPPGTVTRRLTRAKTKIREARIPFRVPPAHLYPERVPVVLACIYLVFTEGYAATSGRHLVRTELCDAGIRLARLLTELIPDSAEAHGLLALLLLQDSRRATRVDADGDLVLLEHQDRTRWDRIRIKEALAALDRAAAIGEAGPYALQGAIAAEHACAATWATTDWARIVELYDELARVAPSPVVGLNHAIAMSFAVAPDAGLQALDALAGDERLTRSHQFHAARADMLRRLGRAEAALDAYERAIERVRTEPERAFLERRLRELPGR